MVVGGLLVPALPPADDAEVGERHRLGGAVAEQAGRVVRAAVDRHRVSVVAARLQVPVQDGGQPGHVTRPALGGGVQRDRDQGGAFGVEPAARLAGGRQLGGRRADGLEAGPVVPFGRDEGVHGAGGDAQVVVEQAGQRGPLTIDAVFGGGELTGVGAQQVVHAVPAAAGRVDEVRAGQQGERVLGLGGGDGAVAGAGRRTGQCGQGGDGV